MQTIWARARLPSYTCRCVSCVKNSGANAVSNRTTSATSRRRLLLGNGVTMFYSSIFAAAMAWDSISKTKRRTERDEEIKAVKAEVERLAYDEIRRLEALTKARQPRWFSQPQQKRQFSSLARHDWARYEAPQSHNMDHGRDTSGRLAPNHEAGGSLEAEEGAGIEEQGDYIEEGQIQGDLSIDDVVRTRAVRRLASRQLAIRMLLRPAIAHLYGSVHLDARYPYNLPELKIEDLLAELNKIRTRINQVRTSRSAWYGDLASDITISDQAHLQEERISLNEELKCLFNLYDKEELDSPDLLVKVADNILSSEEPITAGTITILLKRFTRNKQNDVVTMVMDSLFHSRIPITMGVITASLNFFSKTKDLYRFDGFLTMLQGRSRARTVSTWHEWQSVVFDGMELPVPSTHNGNDRIILASLAIAALSFDQHHRANGWLSVMHDRGYGHTSHTLGAYLRFYSIANNWEKGVPLLLEAVNYISRSTPKAEGIIERLILYMATFCNSCGKHELSQEIINVAVASDIYWETSYNSTDDRLSILSTMRQWSIATEKSMESTSERHFTENYKAFAEKLKPSIQRAVSLNAQELELSKLELDTIPNDLNSSDMAIRELAVERERHSSEVNDLQRHILQQQRIDSAKEELHSSDLTIRDLALEVERESRQAEMNTLKSMIFKIQTTLHDASPTNIENNTPPPIETKFYSLPQTQRQTQQQNKSTSKHSINRTPATNIENTPPPPLESRPSLSFSQVLTRNHVKGKPISEYSIKPGAATHISRPEPPKQIQMEFSGKG